MISKRKRTIVGKEQTESSLKLFFAKNLHFLRAQNNEKQDVLADAIGISQSMISNYEKGTKMPSLEIASRICAHYDVSKYKSVLHKYYPSNINNIQKGFTLKAVCPCNY